jgi:hypothetical protein
MSRLDPRLFDPAKPLRMGRFNTVNGHPLTPGANITIVEGEPKAAGEVTLDQATRLWSGRTFVYAEDARPTPVESPQDAAKRLIELEPLDGGKFLLRAPWLAEAETYDTEAAANERRDALIEAGQPVGSPPAAADAPGGQQGEGDQDDGTTDDRIKALVDANTEVQLRDKIDALNEAREAADPPLAPIEAKGDHNKSDLARLIVEVDGDVETGQEG